MLDAQGRRWYTDPKKADTDGDGLTDREEMGQYVEPDLRPGHPLKTPYWVIASDPNKVDTDGDGLDDAAESSLRTSPLLVDTDHDGLTDKEEQELGTNPLSTDTDHDTIDDASEVYSLYLNPLIPDEYLVSSDEWKVQYYKGFKLDGNCVKTDDGTDLRRCLGTVLREIADKYGLDLNDSWNKEYLPHRGRHPNAYHDWILAQLRRIDRAVAGDKGQFLKLFETDIKQRIRTHPEMLTKAYWQ